MAESATDKLQSIAEEVGVSPNTVLRVLRGENKEVWPSAIRRAAEIREVAQRLGYLPNGSARAMRRGRFNCVSLVLSTSEGRSHLPSDLFNAIHDSLNERQTRLVVSKLRDETLTDRDAVPSILRDWSCDGLLINYTDHIPREMVRLIGQYQIPSIWINSRQEADCVYYDDFGGAMKATQHLLHLGHRNIAYVDFIPIEPPDHTHYSRIDRFEGYAQAMKQAGLFAYGREHFAGVPIADRLKATCALLTRKDRPTAILSYDSGERLAYAASLVGLEVPRDLSVMTFDPRPPAMERDYHGETYFGRDIATMRIPAEVAGRRAVEMLRRKIETPRRRLPAAVVDLELVSGDTCGPCPQ